MLTNYAMNSLNVCCREWLFDDGKAQNDRMLPKTPDEDFYIEFRESQRTTEKRSFHSITTCSHREGRKMKANWYQALVSGRRIETRQRRKLAKMREETKKKQPPRSKKRSKSLCAMYQRFMWPSHWLISCNAQCKSNNNNNNNCKCSTEYGKRNSIDALP